MARKPGVRVVNGHWFSESGGRGRYFGKASEVTHAEAMSRLWAALAGDAPNAFPVEQLKRRATSDSVTPTLSTSSKVTLDGLAGMFLAWVRDHRSDRTHEERARHLQRFIGATGGDRDASALPRGDLEAFLASLTRSGAAPDYVQKHSTSVRALVRWGSSMGTCPTDSTPSAPWNQSGWSDARCSNRTCPQGGRLRRCSGLPMPTPRGPSGT